MEVVKNFIYYLKKPKKKKKAGYKNVAVTSQSKMKH